MQILDIITKKKLGQPLTREEITFFARGAAEHLAAKRQKFKEIAKLNRQAGRG